jgi:hypothetical protein
VPLAPSAAAIADGQFRQASDLGSGVIPLRLGGTVTLTPGATLQRTRLLRWSSSAPEIAPVTADGLVRGKRIGLATISVEGPSGVERTTVQVQEPPPDQSPPVVTAFSVSPRTGPTLAPGATRQFSTQATWSDGLPRSVAVTYSATGGGVSPTGLFTAGSVAGTFLVVANCACGRADTAIVGVQAVAAQLASLRISPKTVSVSAGDTLQFTAQATWSTGATELPPLTWTAAAGAISGSGRFIAPPVAGSFLVIVAHNGGSLRDTAVVTVSQGGTPPPPVDNSLACPNEPAGSVAFPYKPLTFTSTAAVGTQTPGGPPGEWRIYGDDRSV